jgi:signal transduction histidine kinase/CheY-like chemotaxis protein
MKLFQAWRRSTRADAAQRSDAQGVERQIQRIRWGVWLVMGSLSLLWLVYANRSHDFAQEAQRTKAKIAAASVQARLDNALRHMDDILAYTFAAFARHGPGLIDSDTLAQVRGRDTRNPYRQVLVTTAAGDPLLSIPARPLEASLQDIAQAQSNNSDASILSHVVTEKGEALLARSIRLTYSDGTFAGMAVALLDPDLVRDALKANAGESAPTMQVLLSTDVLGQGWGAGAAPERAPVLTLATEAPDLMVQAWISPLAVQQAWLAQLWWPSFFMGCVMGLFLWGSRNLCRSLRQELHNQRLADQRAIEARIHAMFIANISHEIRTPMNGILGACDLLAASRLSEQQAEWAGLMRRSGENLMGIINDILDFSKLEAGQFQLEKKPFPLLQTLEDCCTLLAKSAHDKGLHLHGDLDVSEADWVRSDPLRVRQIVLNLLGNAIKFTEEGHVLLWAQWRPGDGATELHLRVQDSGIGMDAEQLDRLYTPFHQADSSHARRYGGTGLGMSITQHLVGLLGGRLSVKSSPGQGSVFEVWLPLETTPVHEAVAPAPADLPATTPLFVEAVSANWRASWHTHMRHLRQPISGNTSEPAWVLIDSASHPPTREQLPQAVLAYVVLAHPQKVFLPPAEWPMAPLWRLETPPKREAVRALWARLHLRQNPELMAPELPSEKPQASFADKPLAHTADTESPLKVLVVEDHPVNQTIIRAMLARMGCDVDMANNGVQALSAFETSTYDLVLMDCQMPEMDGFDTTRAIRAREALNPTMGRVPVIALTALAMLGDAERCLAAGMDDYLTKPIQLEQLGAKMQRWRPCAESTPGPRM